MQTHSRASSSTGGRSFRRIALILAAAAIVFYTFALWLFFTEGQRPAQPLPLGLLTFAAGLGLAVIGAVLALRWRRLAAWSLIAAGVIQALLAVVALNDPTRPPGATWGSLVFFTLPPFVIAALLLRAPEALGRASRQQE